MFAAPKRYEIDHRTIKLLVGLIAISLPLLTSLATRLLADDVELTSVSQSYRVGGLPRDIFVGFLFAIFAFLLAYNGKSKREMILSKIAAFAALGVAVFPCKCGDHKELIPFVHGASAAVMFIILAVFCYIFHQRASAKHYPQAKLRCRIYVMCGLIIVASMLVIAIDGVLKNAISDKLERLVYYGETAGLVAFGVAWLTASRVLPLISNKEERFSPFQASANDDEP